MDSKETRATYSFDVKTRAVRAHLEDGLTASEAMSRFGVTSKSAFFRWCSSYRDGGVQALEPKRRGRPRKVR